jgi:hypothetical protein
VGFKPAQQLERSVPSISQENYLLGKASASTAAVMFPYWVTDLLLMETVSVSIGNCILGLITFFSSSVYKVLYCHRIKHQT